MLLSSRCRSTAVASPFIRALLTPSASHSRIPFPPPSRYFATTPPPTQPPTVDITVRIQKGQHRFRVESVTPRPSAFPTTPPPPVLSPTERAARARQAVRDAFDYTAREERNLQLRNFALAALCIGFVVWSYYFSQRQVKRSADSLMGEDVDEIERELEEEDRTKDVAMKA